MMHFCKENTQILKDYFFSGVWQSQTLRLTQASSCRLLLNRHNSPRVVMQ